MRTGPTADRQSNSGPGRTVLHQLYVDEQRGFADLTARFGVGTPTVRRWLVEAGIEIRPRGSGGYKRQLSAPPGTELAELGRTLPTSVIADKLEVSRGTVLRWFVEAGVSPPSPTLRTGPAVR